ncbi:MAG: hypothetical protein A2Z18_03065 [Armatimonadetes bacterium RBG_16_58_9]|nr:MAG: hypothetical protein A2Z18_03065 [Armatimonadetes bacterium RBG_16_58_9]
MKGGAVRLADNLPYTKEEKVMKQALVVYLGMAVLLCLAVPALSGPPYSGSITSSTGEILGSGVWIDPGVTVLDWSVTLNTDTSWHYAYTLSVPRGGVSHFILEVSPTFTENDIIGTSGSFGYVVIDTFSPGPGNPNMPGDIYGIKFDEAFGTTATFELDTYRSPVWGNFYSKDGNAGGAGMNTAYNAGFGNPDPLAARIMVPDTDTNIPEPSSLLAFLVGGTSLIGICIRRRI